MHRPNDGALKYHHIDPGKHEHRHLGPEIEVVIVNPGIRHEHQQPRRGRQGKGCPCPFHDIGRHPRKGPPSRRNAEQTEIDDRNCAEHHRQPDDVSRFDQRKQIQGIPDSDGKAGGFQRGEKLGNAHSEISGPWRQRPGAPDMVIGDQASQDDDADPKEQRQYRKPLRGPAFDDRLFPMMFVPLQR